MFIIIKPVAYHMQTNAIRPSSTWQTQYMHHKCQLKWPVTQLYGEQITRQYGKNKWQQVLKK